MTPRQRVPQSPSGVDLSIGKVANILFGPRAPRATVSGRVAVPTLGIISDAVSFNGEHDRAVLDPEAGVKRRG